MRAFITGGTGFAGSHLVETLLQAGHQVVALIHDESSRHELPPAVGYHPVAGDLLDAPGLRRIVAEAAPEAIFHLAGQPSPGLSWKIPARTLAINTIGTINLLEAARLWGRPRVVVVTSSELYGRIKPEDLPLTEDTPPQPRHPYGVSKLAAALLVPLYWERYGLPVVEARPFNHVGPRQGLGFVVPDFASQLAEIKLGRQEPVLAVGNLAARRDFTDVRDVVAAYLGLAVSGRPGASYLVCSGRPVAIRELLDILLELADIHVSIVPDPERLRPADVPSLYGSHARLTGDTGWAPAIALRRSLADTLDEWLSLGATEKGGSGS